MKKLLSLILFTVLSLQGFSQAKKSTTPTNDSTAFTWKTGMDELVSVKYLSNCEVPDSTLSKMVIKSMVDAKYACKNKATYKPVEVFVYAKEEEDKINVAVKFFASNAYGVPDKLNLIATYDKKGNQLSKLTY